MTTESFNYVLAGHLFHCIKCQQCFGRVNKMDGSGDVEEKDCSVDEYRKQIDIMEEQKKNKEVLLMTTFLENITCNKCLY